DGDKPHRQQMVLEEAPVVLLAVANVALPLSPVEATALDLGGYLPAEYLAVGHARHHRAHEFARPPFGLPSPWLRLGFEWGGLLGRTTGRGSAPRFHFGGQPGRLDRVEKLPRGLRLRVGGMDPRRERLAAGHFDLAPSRVHDTSAAVLSSGLYASSVHHHRRDRRGLGIVRSQSARSEGLDVRVT